MMRKLTFCMITALALGACQSTTAPKQEPTPEQRAELEQARTNLITAECALYEEAKKMQPGYELPEQCKP